MIYYFNTYIFDHRFMRENSLKMVKITLPKIQIKRENHIIWENISKHTCFDK